MDKIFKYLWLTFFLPGVAIAASPQYLGLDKVFVRPVNTKTIHQFAVNLTSNTTPVSRKQINKTLLESGYLVYSNKVKINNKLYYRLVLGNFPDQATATKKLKTFKESYPGAWINKRSNQEATDLRKEFSRAGIRVKKPTAKKAIPPRIAMPKQSKMGKKSKKTFPLNNKTLSEKLMEDARNNLIDENYPRVLAITGKLAEIGNQEQKEFALELSGIVRERQGKFAQAVASYQAFLQKYPNSKRVPRIKSRIEGLKTMFNEPRAPIEEPQGLASQWDIYGSLTQTYQNVSLDIDTLDSRDIGDQLVSDLFIIGRKKSNTDFIEYKFDGGMVNDFLDKEDDGYISLAQMHYANNVDEYSLTIGRQKRTAKGIYDRFDGLVYNNSRMQIDWSIYMGAPVIKTADDFDSGRKFIGTSITTKISSSLTMDFYLVTQDIESLTDRQSIGSELQYRSDKGFLFGIVDYDLFYEDLNNLTIISNYRHDETWSFNTTLDYRNNPLISSYNAIQGQGVETFSDLITEKNLSEDQIYQLARDRTSKAASVYFTANQLIDNHHQLYYGLSLSNIDATEASSATATTGPIEARPEFNSTDFTIDYTINNFLGINDFSTVGFKILDNSNYQALSLRSRSRMPGGINKLYFTPRFDMDFRSGKDTKTDQTILRPSLKVTYRPNKRVNFESSLGMELSNEDIPDSNDQTITSFLLGYSYHF